MEQLIQVPLTDQGGFVVASVTQQQSASGIERTSFDSSKIAETLAGASMATALEAVIRPTARVLIDELRKIQPDGIELEFGLTLSGKAGLVFASSEMEGHFAVKLSWRRESPASDAT